MEIVYVLLIEQKLCHHNYFDTPFNLKGSLELFFKSRVLVFDRIVICYLHACNKMISEAN